MKNGKNLPRTLLSLFLLSLMLLGIFSFAGCQADEYDDVKMEIDVDNDGVVDGTIVIRLDPKMAPKTCANFAALVHDGFYNGLTFHRVAVMSTSKSNYIIQGGDPKGDGSGGSNNKITGEFKNNGYFNNTLSLERGVIAMARSSGYDSASSQFFICVGDCTELDGNYAGFGRVVKGMEVADKIAAVKVDSNNKPVTPVTIKRATCRANVTYTGRFFIALAADLLVIAAFLLVYGLYLKPTMEADIVAAIGPDKRSRARLEKQASGLSSFLYLHARDMIGPAHRWYLCFTFGCLLCAALAWVCAFAFYPFVWIPTAVIVLLTAGSVLLFRAEKKGDQKKA